jgi:hypothetical protein
MALIDSSPRAFQPSVGGLVFSLAQNENSEKPRPRCLRVVRLNLTVIFFLKLGKHS